MFIRERIHMKLKYVLIGIFAISLASNSLAMEENATNVSDESTKNGAQTETSLVQKFEAAQKSGGKLSSDDFSSIRKQLTQLNLAKEVVPSLFVNNRLITLNDRRKTAETDNEAFTIVIGNKKVKIILGGEGQTQKQLYLSINSVPNNLNTPPCFLSLLSEFLKDNPQEVCGVTVDNDGRTVMGPICKACYTNAQIVHARYNTMLAVMQILEQK